MTRNPFEYEIGYHSGKLRLNKFYHIECAWCANNDYNSGPTISRASTVKLFKEQGWQKIIGHGWVCPECVKEFK